MASRDRPGSARRRIGRQRAETRRNAPGKRFIGERAEQSAAARRAELQRVRELAQAEAAARRAEALERPLVAIVVELVQGATRLAATLATAPLRLAIATLRIPRAA
jgi:hypothetical protein